MSKDTPPVPGALTRLFLRNTGANLALRAFSVIASLTATAALLHGYGEDRFALVALALQLAGLASLATPGLPGAVTREIAAAIGQGAPSEAARLARAMARIYVLGGLLLGGGIALFAAPGGMAIFRFPPGVREEGTLVLGLAGLVLLLRTAFAAWGDVLAGLQEYPRLATIRSATALAIAAGVTAVAWTGKPLAAVIAVHGLGRLLEGLSLRRAALRLLPPVRVPLGETLRAARPAARIGTEMAVFELAGVVHYRVDTFVLALLASARAVAGYQVTVRLHNLLREIQGTFSSALVPLVARETSGGNRAALEQVVYRGTRYNLVVLLPVIVPAVLFAGDFLRLWLGPGWDRWGTLAALYAGYWAVAALVAFTGQAAIGTDHVRPLAVIAALTAVVNLGVSVLLAPRYGVAGVLAGTLAGDGLALPLQFAAIFPRLGIRPGRFLREVVLPVYPAALAAFAGLLAARRAVPAPGSIAALLLQGGAAGLVVLVAVALTATDRRDRERILRALRGRN